MAANNKPTLEGIKETLHEYIFPVGKNESMINTIAKEYLNKNIQTYAEIDNQLKEDGYTLRGLPIGKPNTTGGKRIHRKQKTRNRRLRRNRRKTHRN